MLNFNVVQLHGAAIEVLEQLAHVGQVKPAPGDSIDRLAERPALSQVESGIKSAVGILNREILVEDDQRLTDRTQNCLRVTARVPRFSQAALQIAHIYQLQ